jgi:hypothetical protein
LQINVLSLAYRAGARVTPYERIARQLEREFAMPQSAESVRGVVNRLAARGFLRRAPARDGTIRGVRFTIVEALLCPHIRPDRGDARPAIRVDARGDARPDPPAAPSILKEKTDRENLLSLSSEENAGQKAVRLLEALSEDDIAYHWPRLAKAGFGAYQIRQIVNRLGQVGNSVEQVMQGLRYAEWELEHGAMLDKSSSPVASPVDWVFASLAKTGYYRRPKGYVSPEEQAELDAAENAKQLATAMEARKLSELQAWTASLSSDERKAITAQPGKTFAMPDDVALKLHFNNHIWPKILAESKQPGDDHAQ